MNFYYSICFLLLAYLLIVKDPCFSKPGKYLISNTLSHALYKQMFLDTLQIKNIDLS